MSERKRKDNGLLSSVKDVDSSDDEQQQSSASGVLPISHEVILAGH
jgi:hypothetical protein